MKMIAAFSHIQTILVVFCLVVTSSTFCVSVVAEGTFYEAEPQRVVDHPSTSSEGNPERNGANAGEDVKPNKHHNTAHNHVRTSSNNGPHKKTNMNHHHQVSNSFSSVPANRDDGGFEYEVQEQNVEKEGEIEVASCSVPSVYCNHHTDCCSGWCDRTYTCYCVPRNAYGCWEDKNCCENSWQYCDKKDWYCKAKPPGYWLP